MKKTPPIKMLPPELCNQIAAGEVVERPASVVKELLENALDAHATDINITVEDGGQSLIKVQDNGMGIPSNELELAITRHATSKLHDIAGLSNINSYGFRGEALPSIASVSRFRAASIVEGGEGVELLVEFGKTIHTAPTSIRQGTIMEVRDLFFNIPARLKFLKNPATELKRATELFLRLALVAEGVGLTFHAGSRLTHTFHISDDLHKRLTHIWAPPIIEALIPLCYESHGIKVSGYTSNPRSHQPRADRMLFYVNNRAVSDKLLMRAVRQAYQGKITTRDYPQCLICLDINPHEIDVNVHPAKSEVRFRDEQAIFSCIMRAISSALDKDTRTFSAKNLQNQESTPFGFSETHANQQISSPSHPKGFWGKADTTHNYMLDKKNLQTKTFENDTWEISTSHATTPDSSNIPNSSMTNDHVSIPENSMTAHIPHPNIPKTDSPTFPKSLEREHIEASLDATLPSPRASLQENPIPMVKLTLHNAILPHDFDYLGQVAKNYLVIKKGEDLLLLDQHAAHERIIYEKIANHNVNSQHLLLPIEYPMHITEQRRLEEILPKLQALAFHITVKNTTCVVNAIPENLDRIQASAFLKEILSEKSDDLQRIWIHHACISALKSGTDLDHSSALNLIQTWLQCEEPDFCPHGRPCALFLTKDDLERMFKRKA